MSTKARANLFLDTAIFAVLLLAFAPRVTGIAIHEWLALAFAGAVVVHLLFHWEWIIGVATRFFTKLFHESRLNFVVDLAFFLALITIMVSGIVISKVAMPALGIRFSFSPLWKSAHRISAEVALVAFAVHCGLHYKWIIQNAKRFIVDPVAGLFGKQPASIMTEGGK